MSGLSTLARKMRLLADQDHPRADDLRRLATEWERTQFTFRNSAAEDMSFYLSLHNAWLRARNCYLECMPSK